MDDTPIRLVLIKKSLHEEENKETLPVINAKDIFSRARKSINKIQEMKIKNPIKKDKLFERLSRKINDEKKKTIRILNKLHIENPHKKNERSVIDNWKEIDENLSKIHRSFINHPLRNNNPYNLKNTIKRGTNRRNKKLYLNADNNHINDNRKMNKDIKRVMIDLYESFSHDKKDIKRLNNSYEHHIAKTETDKIIPKSLPGCYQKQYNYQLMLHSKRD